MASWRIAHPHPNNQVDEEPFRTENFTVPSAVVRDAAKSKAALRKRPADGEEVKQFVFDTPTVKCFRDFTKMVDQKVVAEPCNMMYKRLSAFASKNRDAKAIVELSVERRNDLRPNTDALKDYFLASLKTVCTCSSPSALLNCLKESLEYHDKEEMRKNTSRIIGQWACRLIDPAVGFKDRKQTLYIIGVPGSGESTILNCFLNMVPKERRFVVDFGSSFPFAPLRDTYVIADYNEFRINPRHSPSVWLQVLARSPVQVDVKGQESVFVESPRPQ